MKPTAIDPPTCACTECITGEYIPLADATPRQITDMLAGRLRNNTGLETQSPRSASSSPTRSGHSASRTPRRLRSRPKHGSAGTTTPGRSPGRSTRPRCHPESMTKHRSWLDLRDRRMASPEARAGYERARVEIDPNVRARGNGTFTGLDDVYGAIAVGDPVEVFESEANIVGDGTVTDIDETKGLVYLDVDWPSLRDADDA